jgi:spore coat polysaccharide biosynthesis protein SpsF
MVLVVVQARCGSTRLPRKVLAPLAGRELILRLLDRVRVAECVDRLVVATTIDRSDDALVDLLLSESIEVRRGPVDDVLSRFILVMDEFPSDTVVRLTGDNPLVEAMTVDLVVAEHLTSGADYTTNGLSRTFPHGLNVEAFSSSALRQLASMSLSDEEREHVTLGLVRRGQQFRQRAVSQTPDRSSWRWTVDVEADLKWAHAIFERLSPADPYFGQEDVARLIGEEPHLLRLMADVP